MDFATYRKSLGLSQEECAHALGVRSKGYISDIETGARHASLRLALKIQAWSGGKVDASTLCPQVSEIESVRPRRRRAA